MPAPSATEDKKAAPPRAAVHPAPVAESSPGLRDVQELRIPVALVRFDRPIQYPGRQQDDQCKTETSSNGKSWAVEYLPAMRHFRIAYSDPARNEKKVGYVHEIRALGWEPER